MRPARQFTFRPERGEPASFRAFADASIAPVSVYVVTEQDELRRTRTRSVHQHFQTALRRALEMWNDMQDEEDCFPAHLSIPAIIRFLEVLDVEVEVNEVVEAAMIVFAEGGPSVRVTKHPLFE